MKRSIINLNVLESINQTLFELACLPRWSALTTDADRFSELGKQALNAFITYLWCLEAIHEGSPINLTLIPKVALMRCFTKSEQCDIPEYCLDEIFKLGNVTKGKFANMVKQKVIDSCGPRFASYLNVPPMSLESQIFKGATKIATMLELEDLQFSIPKKEYESKKNQLQDILATYSDLPAFHKICTPEYMEIFRSYSQLRNRVRWAKHPKIIQSSVLGHCMDVAVLAYLQSLDIDPNDQELASRYFFMGLLHDFAERWTGDMPSPVKDRIYGLRKATEQFENLVLELHFYSKLPDYMVEELRPVMLEDPSAQHYKKLLKVNDNLGALLECWREYDAGTRHRYYIDVIRRDYVRYFPDPVGTSPLSPSFQLLVGKLYETLS